MRRPDRRRERGGPFYAHGQVRGGPRRDWSPWRERDFGPRYREARGGMSADPALRRGEWQRRGRGPDAWEGYGWEFRGGAPAGEYARWPERNPGAREGGGRLLAERRSGGLPRGRGRFNPDEWWTEERVGRRRSRRRGWD